MFFKRVFYNRYFSTDIMYRVLIPDSGLLHLVLYTFSNLCCFKTIGLPNLGLYTFWIFVVSKLWVFRNMKSRYWLDSSRVNLTFKKSSKQAPHLSSKKGYGWRVTCKEIGLGLERRETQVYHWWVIIKYIYFNWRCIMKIMGYHICHWKFT